MSCFAVSPIRPAKIFERFRSVHVLLAFEGAPSNPFKVAPASGAKPGLLEDTLGGSDSRDLSHDALSATPASRKANLREDRLALSRGSLVRACVS